MLVLGNATYKTHRQNYDVDIVMEFCVLASVFPRPAICAPLINTSLVKEERDECSRANKGPITTETNERRNPKHPRSKMQDR